MYQLTLQGLALALIIIICSHSLDGMMMKYGCKMIREEGYYIPKSDYVGITTEKRCYALCLLMASCMGADYNIHSHDCYLNSHLRGKKPSKLYIHYKKSCLRVNHAAEVAQMASESCKMDARSGIYSPGISGFVAQTLPSTCSEICRAIPGCKFVDYHFRSRKCYMHKKAFVKLHSNTTVQLEKKCGGLSQNPKVAALQARALSQKTKSGFSLNTKHEIKYKGCLMIEQKGHHSPSAGYLGKTSKTKCIELCLLMPKCKTADYNTVGQRCYVTDKIKPQKTDKFFIHYLKYCSAHSEGARASKQLTGTCTMTMKPGYYSLRNSAFAGFTTLRKCSSICENVPTCKFSDYVLKTHKCYLHKEVIKLHRSKCCVHFIKQCHGQK